MQKLNWALICLRSLLSHFLGCSLLWKCSLYCTWYSLKHKLKEKERNQILLFGHPESWCQVQEIVAPGISLLSSFRSGGWREVWEETGWTAVAKSWFFHFLQYPPFKCMAKGMDGVSSGSQMIVLLMPLSRVFWKDKCSLVCPLDRWTCKWGPLGESKTRCAIKWNVITGTGIS